MSRAISHSASRIPGLGSTLYRLRRELERVRQFGEHRARTDAERRLAAQLFDHIKLAVDDALESAVARSSLQAYTERRRVSRKSRRSICDSVHVQVNEGR